MGRANSFGDGGDLRVVAGGEHHRVGDEPFRHPGDERRKCRRETLHAIAAVGPDQRGDHRGVVAAFISVFVARLERTGAS
jgi:hypothetical protein